jgi:hypothetical protein
MNDSAISLYIGILHFLADLITLILPIHLINGLNITLRQQFSILLVLCLEFVAFAAGVRVHYTYTVISIYDQWASYSVGITAGIGANLGSVYILYETCRNNSLLLTASFRYALVRQLFASFLRLQSKVQNQP